MDQATPFQQITLGWPDWLTVGVFLAVVIGFALYVKFQQNGSEDFFLAGRSMGWIVVMFSTFATLFSTISFVAVPGEAYDNGVMIGSKLLISWMFYPLGIWLFLRFFFFAPTFTAYEYLERRYNLGTRLTGAGIYCITRMLYAGVVFYAAAQVFQSLVGWSPMWTITIVGGFTILYTATGGMKAVMFTDTVQGLVVVVGIGAIFYALLSSAGFDVGAIYDYAASQDKGLGRWGEASFYQVDFYDRVNLYLLLIGAVIVPLSNMSADQSVVQRLLSSRGYADAKKAIMINVLISIPIVGMLWFIGIALLYHYNHDASLPAGINADQVMGYFINAELPTPLPGLITAALLAALMSTIDSTVNCVANVVHRDGLVRLGATTAGSPRELSLCRWLSVGAGLLSVVLAVGLTVGGEGVKTSVLELVGIWSSLWGVLLMAFLLGVLVPRVGGWSMFAGLIGGSAISLYLPYALYYSVPADQRVSFLWIGLPGTFFAGLFPLLLCVFLPNRGALPRLTLWTLATDSSRDNDSSTATETRGRPSAAATTEE